MSYSSFYGKERNQLREAYYDWGILYFTKVIEKNPEDVFAHHIRRLIYGKKSCDICDKDETIKIDDAIGELIKSLNINPEQSNILSDIGYAFYYKGLGYENNRPLSKVNFYPIKSSGQIPVLKEV